MAYECRVPRKMFGAKVQVITEDRQFQNEEIYDLYSFK